MALHIESFEDNHMGIVPDVYSLVDDDDSHAMHIEVTCGGPHAYSLANGTTLEEPVSGSELVVRPPVTDQNRLNTVVLAFGSLLRAVPHEQ